LNFGVFNVFLRHIHPKEVDLSEKAVAKLIEHAYQALQKPGPGKANELGQLAVDVVETKNIKLTPVWPKERAEILDRCARLAKDYHAEGKPEFRSFGHLMWYCIGPRAQRSWTK
jgi:hypothetical protein